MGKRVDYEVLRAGRGLARGLDAGFDEACERNGVPIEAIRRLVTPAASATWDAIVERILADYEAEQPRPPVFQNGHHPYRGGTVTTEQPSTEMTIGGRTYEILGFLRGEEKSVKGAVMVKRAKELNANLGQEDCEFILEHQDQIPGEFRGKVAFVFPDWRYPGNPAYVACVYWHDDRWVQGWDWLGSGWGVRVRLLRRK